MNEANSMRHPRKRRSFLWLWILLLLAAFTGGIVLGLKLNTLPLPNDVQTRLYPVLEAIIPGSTAARPQEAATAPAPVVTPAPPVETLPPAPAETAVPVELPPVPAETAAPVELRPVPAEEPVQPEATPPLEVVVPVELTVSESERFESAPVKSIGVDAALDAALKYAEVEKKDAEVTGVYRTKDEDGQSVYEVAFTVGELSYEYIVSASDGEILGWKISGFHVENSETFGAETDKPAPAEPEKK